MASKVNRTRPSISCRSSLMYLVCGLLLLTSVRGEALSKISVPQGKSFILFPKVDPVKEITLYKNGKTNYTNIVTWKNDNGAIMPFWGNNYTYFRKISMDHGQAIWIENFDESYIGKYCRQIPDHNESCIEVELDMQDNQTSHVWMPVSFFIMCLIVTAIIVGGLTGIICYKCKTRRSTEKPDGVELTNLGRLTEKPDEAELANTDECLTTDGPWCSDYGVHHMVPYGADNQRRRQRPLSQKDSNYYKDRFSPSLERVTHPLPEEQAADPLLNQSSEVEETKYLIHEGQAADRPSGVKILPENLKMQT